VDVIAWVGLVVSWLLILLVVKFVFIVLRVLKQTRRLAQMSSDAAVQLADNLADEEAFAEFELLAAQLPQAVRGLPRGAAPARRRGSSVSPGIGGRFS
jgi:type VI protein secretion system component VasK